MSHQEAAAFMEAITKSPQLKVLNILAEKPAQELTKTEIASKAGIGRTTLYRIWDDLEKMKAIRPVRQVGPVTLYTLNMSSATVQSLMSVRERLENVSRAIGKIQEIRELEKAGAAQPAMPTGPSVLVKILEAGADSRENAFPLEKLRLSEEERETINNLKEANLVDEYEKKISLTPFGLITARGAVQIWRSKDKKSIEDKLSELKQALNLINQDIKKIRSKLPG